MGEGRVCPHPEGLDFQREVNAALAAPVSGALPVNMGNAPAWRDSGGRLALFVRSKTAPPATQKLSAVLADNRPVDIYLVDSPGGDDALRSWAQDHHIPVEKVRKRQITLNHDGSRWMRFGNGLMPVLLQQAGRR